MDPVFLSAQISWQGADTTVVGSPIVFLNGP
jgi:hypothetical protein